MVNVLQLLSIAIQIGGGVVEWLPGRSCLLTMTGTAEQTATQRGGENPLLCIVPIEDNTFGLIPSLTMTYICGIGHDDDITPYSHAFAQIFLYSLIFSAAALTT